MVDLHSHILHLVDDGARTLEESLEIARAAVADGIEVMAATPHVRDDYPTDAGVMEYRLFQVREAVAAAGIPLDVRSGGEIDNEWLTRLSPADLARFGLGGNPRYLLVETPYYGWPLALGDRLFHLRASGITPVIAHPERNAEVRSQPERLVPLVEAGALVQVTAASVDGRLGRRIAETAQLLIENELAHLIASDAHHASVRAVGMAAAVEAIGDAALAGWLAVDVPSAIVRDEPLPPRPQGRKRGGGWRRFLGA